MEFMGNLTSLSSDIGCLPPSLSLLAAALFFVRRARVSAKCFDLGDFVLVSYQENSAEAVGRRKYLKSSDCSAAVLLKVGCLFLGCSVDKSNGSERASWFDDDGCAWSVASSIGGGVERILPSIWISFERYFRIVS